MKAEASACHKNFKRYGIRSLQILSKEISNCRYPGFSEFFSSNALQNSHYIYSIPRDKRMKAKDDRKLCDNIYNLPMLKSTRAASIGFGGRRYPFPMFGQGTPGANAYNIRAEIERNLEKLKGASLRQRFNYGKDEKSRQPGPGAYNLASEPSYKRFGTIPATMKFRHGFFYDDDIKQKKATVSMQKYTPNHTLTEQRRFNGVSFGIGDRPELSVNTKTPGPGAYMLSGCFDRGLKGKLAMN